MVKLKRAYEPASRSDGWRVLVERLWPRGVKKEDLALDAWEKEIAPSTALRQWYGHDTARWEEFRTRYLDEVRETPARALARELAQRAEKGTVTLVFAARDAEHSGAAVLKEELDRLAKRRPRPARRA